MSAQTISSSSIVRISNISGLVKSFRHAQIPQKGRLILLVKAQEEIAQNTIAQIVDSYFASEEESLLTALKESIQSSIESAVLLSEISILGAVIQGEYLYLCGWGEFAVFVSRGEMFTQIFKGRSQSVGSCSGVIKEGDTFLLLEGNIEAGKSESLKDLFTNEDPLSLASAINDHVQNPLAVLIKIDSISSHEDEIEVEEIIPQKEEIAEEIPEVEIPNTPEERTINLRSNKSLLVRFAEMLPEKNPFEGKPPRGNSKRTAVSAGFILIGLLLLSIIFGIGQKKNVAFKSSYQDELSKAQIQYTQSISQKDINPTQARELLSQAKVTIDGLVAKNVQDSQVTNLKTEIDAAAPLILGLVDITPTTLVDLSLVRQGIKGEEISSDGDTLSILDTQGNRIIFSDFDGKNIGVSGGSDKASEMKTFTSSNNKFYGLTDQGVLSLTKQGALDTVINKDDQWGSISKIGMYGGNFYLIDAIGAIWRYTPSSQEKINWLKGQTNLSTVEDLAVDGALWVLTDGKIIKFVRGQGQIVSPIGLNQGFSSPKALYTDESLDSLFILDPQSKRIVEMDKQGLYKKAYVNELIGSVKDFVVSKSAGKIVLLTEAKVLELPLK